MKKITRITTQQKNASRYNIFLDDGNGEAFAFGVDEAVLIEFRLRKGLELDEETIKKITQKERLYQFYTQSIHFLSYRMRTKKEIYDYLMKKELEPEYIEKIIERLTKEKLLNDREFAEMFVRTRMNTSSKGPKLIEQELREKGVSAAIIASVIPMYGYEEQYDKAYKFMEKKLRQSTKHAFRKRMEQLQMNLIRKGFASDVVKDVASEFSGELDTDEEWDALVFQGEKLVRRHAAKFSGYELRNKIKEGLYRKGFPFDLIERFIEEQIEQE